MKLASTICLLVLMLSIQTPVGQLFKLPYLIGHFIKHQELTGVSLIDFLDTHYSPDHNDEDLPEDEQLPFKNVTFHTIGYAILPSVFKEEVIEALHVDKKVNFSETFVSQQHLAGVFHPPRA